MLMEKWKMVQPLEKTSGGWVVAQEVNRDSAYDPAIPLAGIHIHARGKTQVHTCAGMRTFTVARPATARKQKQHTRSLTTGWGSHRLQIHNGILFSWEKAGKY